MSTGTLGGLALAIAIWLMWRKKARKTQVVLMLVAGLASTGLVWDVANRLGQYVFGLASAATVIMVGTTAGLILGVLLLLELWHAAHPKKGRPSAYHPWLALLAPAVLIACGGFFSSTVHAAHSGVGQVAPAINQVVHASVNGGR